LLRRIRLRERVMLGLRLEGTLPLAGLEQAIDQDGLVRLERLGLVDRDDVAESLSLGTEEGVGTSDALAVVLMRRHGLREVYSFDRDFDRWTDIRRISA